MSLLQRLVHKIVPPPACGHETELDRLRGELHRVETLNVTISDRLRDETRLADQLRGQLAAIEADRLTVRDQLRAIEKEIAAGHPSDLPYSSAIKSLRDQRELSAHGLGELAEALEEATTRIAVLEGAAREDQHALFDHDPASVEAGGEAPIAGPVQLSDRVDRLFFRLVSVYLDADARHYWQVQRGEERVAKVQVRDKDFLEQIAKGEVVFVAGTVLEGDTRVVTWRDPDNSVSIEYVSIDKVHRVVRPPEQVEIVPPPPPPTHCDCGVKLRTSVDRGFSSCSKCRRAATDAQRIANGTLTRREEAPGAGTSD